MANKIIRRFKKGYKKRKRIKAAMKRTYERKATNLYLTSQLSNHKNIHSTHKNVKGMREI